MNAVSRDVHRVALVVAEIDEGVLRHAAVGNRVGLDEAIRVAGDVGVQLEREDSLAGQEQKEVATVVLIGREARADFFATVGPDAWVLAEELAGDTVARRPARLVRRRLAIVGVASDQGIVEEVCAVLKSC